MEKLSTSPSFKSFKKIIAASTIQHKSEREPTVELCLESIIDEDQCLLGLESQKSKLEELGIKSSIDSNKKPSSNNTSVPLSELILRDNGYDYMFVTGVDRKKMERRRQLNLREIKAQTQQMLDIIACQLVEMQINETKQKIEELKQELSQIRIYRKSKSPVQTYSDYYAYTGNHRKQRKTGKYLSKPMRKSRSNLKTQCDSKCPSLSSTPLTPIPQRKYIGQPAPQKSFQSQYFSLLQSKKQIIESSIQTSKSYYQKRIHEYQQELNVVNKEIILIDSQLISTPTRRNNFRMTVGYTDHSQSHKSNTKNSRQLLRFHSPITPRQSKKSQMGRLLSRGRRELLGGAREEYCIRC